MEKIKRRSLTVHRWQHLLLLVILALTGSVPAMAQTIPDPVITPTSGPSLTEVQITWPGQNIFEGMAGYGGVLIDGQMLGSSGSDKTYYVEDNILYIIAPTPITKPGTYTITVPTDAVTFPGLSFRSNSQFTFEYTVTDSSDPEPEPSDGPVITPTKSESFTEIQITWPGQTIRDGDGSYSGVLLDGETMGYYNTYYVANNILYITPPDPINKVGTHTITVPADAVRFTSQGNKSNEQFTFQIEVIEPAPEVDPLPGEDSPTFGMGTISPVLWSGDYSSGIAYAFPDDFTITYTKDVRITNNPDVLAQATFTYNWEPQSAVANFYSVSGNVVTFDVKAAVESLGLSADAAGSYDFTIPKGLFVAADGSVNDEQIFQWVISAKTVGFDPDYWTSIPPKGLHSGAQVSEIVYEWEGFTPVSADASLVRFHKDGTPWAYVNSIDIIGNTFVIKLDKTYDAAGSYALEAEQGAFTLKDAEGTTYQSEYDEIIYTLEAYSISPAEFEVVEGPISSIKIIGSGLAAGTASVSGVTLKAGGTAASAVVATGASIQTTSDGLEILFNEPYNTTEAQIQAYITIPAGIFTSGGVGNTAITNQEFYLRGAAPEPSFVDGEEGDELGKVRISWNGDVLTLTNQGTITIDTPSQNGVAVDASNISIENLYEDTEVDGAGPAGSYLVIDLSASPYTAGGQYTINIPAGFVNLVSYKTANEAAQLVYTVNASLSFMDDAQLMFPASTTYTNTPGDVVLMWAGNDVVANTTPLEVTVEGPNGSTKVAATIVPVETTDTGENMGYPYSTLSFNLGSVANNYQYGNYTVTIPEGLVAAEGNENLINPLQTIDFEWYRSNDDFTITPAFGDQATAPVFSPAELSAVKITWDGITGVERNPDVTGLVAQLNGSDTGSSVIELDGLVKTEGDALVVDLSGLAVGTYRLYMPDAYVYLTPASGAKQINYAIGYNDWFTVFNGMSAGTPLPPFDGDEYIPSTQEFVEIEYAGQELTLTGSGSVLMYPDEWKEFTPVTIPTGNVTVSGSVLRIEYAGVELNENFVSTQRVIVIPEGLVKNASGALNPEQSIIFNVEEAAAIVTTPAIWNPEKGSYINPATDKITLTWDDAAYISYNGEGYLVGPDGQQKELKAYDQFFASDAPVEVVAKDPAYSWLMNLVQFDFSKMNLADGEYKIVMPAGVFSIEINDVPNANPLIEYTFNVGEEPKESYMDPATVIDPVGEYHYTLTQFNVTWDKQAISLTENQGEGTLTAGGRTFDIQWKLFNGDATGPDSGAVGPGGEDTGSGEDDRVNNAMQISIVIDPMESYIWFFNPPQGEYVFTLPAGVVQNAEGELNPEQEFTFYVYSQTEIEPTVDPEAEYNWVYSVDNGEWQMFDTEPTEVDALTTVSVSWAGNPIELTDGAVFTLSRPGETGNVDIVPTISDNKLVFDISQYTTEFGEYSVNIGGASLLITEEGGDKLNRELIYKYVIPTPAIPDWTSEPADGETREGAEDMLKVIWGYNTLRMVNNEGITVMYDGDDVYNTAVIFDYNGPGEENDPNYKPGEDNVLLIYTNNMVTDYGTYEITVPANTVEINVDGKWVPNQLVEFSYTAEPYKNWIDIAATITPECVPNDSEPAVVNELTKVTLNYQNNPLAIEDGAEVTIKVDNGVAQTLKQSEITLDGNTLVFNLEAYVDGEGTYELSIPQESFTMTMGGATYYNTQMTLLYKLVAPASFMDKAEVVEPINEYLANLFSVTLTWDGEPISIVGDASQVTVTVDGDTFEASQLMIVPVDLAGESEPGITKAAGANDNGLLISFPTFDLMGLTGEFVVNIAEGVVENNDGEINPAQEFTFNVLKRSTVVPTINPEMELNYGQGVVTVDELGQITITWDDLPIELGNSGIRIDQTNVDNLVKIEGNTLYINTENLTSEDGTYEIIIPEGAVIITENGQETLSGELTLTITVEKKAPAPEYLGQPSISPANGSRLPQLAITTLSWSNIKWDIPGSGTDTYTLPSEAKGKVHVTVNGEPVVFDAMGASLIAVNSKGTNEGSGGSGEVDGPSIIKINFPDIAFNWVGEIKVKVDAGLLNTVDGKTTPEIEFTYNVVKLADVRPISDPAAVDLENPDNYVALEELDELTVSWPGLKVASIAQNAQFTLLLPTTVNEDNDIVETRVPVTAELSNGSLVFELGEVTGLDGSYTLNIPEYAVTFADGKNNSPAQLTYIVKHPAQELDYLGQPDEILPDPAEPNPGLSYINLYWNNATWDIPVARQNPYTLPGDMNSKIKVTVNGTVVPNAISNVKAINTMLTNEGSGGSGTSDGPAQLQINFGMDAFMWTGEVVITLDENVISTVDGKVNPQVVITYNVAKLYETAPVSDPAAVDLNNPDQYVALGELDKVTLTWEGLEVEEILSTAKFVLILPATVNDNDDVVETRVPVTPTLSNDGELVFELGDCTEADGTYVLDVVENSVALSNGMNNGPFQLTYIVLHETDGISTIVGAEEGWYYVYNMNGVLLLKTDNASDLNLLEGGLYIVNGKKILLRK